MNSDMEHDSYRAGELQAYRWESGIGADDAAWLEAWEDRNSPPSDWEDVHQVGYLHRSDLGVYLEGFEVICNEPYHRYVAGNVNVGGGWSWHIGGVLHPNGWTRGYWADVHGIESFAQAFGLEFPEWMVSPLGPFHVPTFPRMDEPSAQTAVAHRLMSCLAFVSAAAGNATLEALDPAHLTGAPHVGDLVTSIEPDGSCFLSHDFQLAQPIGCTVGKNREPGSWWWNIDRRDDNPGYLVTVEGLRAFCAALRAEPPADADGKIESSTEAWHSPATAYEVALHRLNLRLLATLWHASRAAVESYGPAASVMLQQRAEFDRKVQSERATIVEPIAALNEPPLPFAPDQSESGSSHRGGSPGTTGSKRSTCGADDRNQ